MGSVPRQHEKRAAAAAYEAVRFSGFSIQEVAVLGTSQNNLEDSRISISNPVTENIELSEAILKKYNKVQLYDVLGKKLI